MPHVSGTMQYLFFFHWLTSLSVISSNSTMLSHKVEFPSFLRLKIVHCVCVHMSIYFSAYLPIAHFLHPLLCQWTIRWFPLLGYPEECCNEHERANIALRSWRQFFWIYAQSGTAGSYGNSALNIWGCIILFSIIAVPFHILTSNVQRLVILHPHQHLLKLLWL